MNDHVTAAAFRDLLIAVARFYKRWIRPQPFMGTFYIDGVEVEVKVREVEPDTKPLKGSR